MSLTKRTVFTVITPLPPSITRDQAIRTLHDHGTLITLNPLVQNYTSTTPHASAPSDEQDPACTWYEITDTIHYLPYNLASGNVTYKACFHDVPTGCQTHVYAPSGLDIRAKWSVGGNEKGEAREERELGLEAPREGLYYREDVDMRCNFLLTGFVKGNLKKSHETLKEKLVAKFLEGGEVTVGGETGHVRQDSKSTEASLASRNKPLPELPQQNSQQRLSTEGRTSRPSSHWEREPSNLRNSFQGHHSNVAQQAELPAQNPLVHDGKHYGPHSDLDVKYSDCAQSPERNSRSVTPRSEGSGHARYPSQNLDPASAQHAPPRPRAELQ